jgi:alpha-D-xyloside xylohydrolase
VIARNGGLLQISLPNEYTFGVKPILTHASAVIALSLFALFHLTAPAHSEPDSTADDIPGITFDAASGEIAFRISAAENEPDQVTLPPISLNGEIQSGFRPVSGRVNAFENSLLRLEWERAAPDAIAVTWSTRDRSTGTFELKIADNSSYYGGGERFHSINQKGFILPMASQDHPEDKGTSTYKPVPFYMSSRGYGIWVDSYAPGQFDLNATDRFHCILRYPENRLRIVFIAATAFPDMLETFTGLSGRITVPPPWAFAPWKSRDVHRNREDVLQDVDLHRKHDLPASVLVIDSPWETGYNDFTLNETQFIEPDTMFAEIERQGFYVSLWLTPFVNSRNVVDMTGIKPGASANYQEASEKGFLVKQPDGSVMTREWWKGEGGLLDFTNPRAVEWWHGQLDQTRKWRIVRSFKADDGEGTFVGDAAFHDGTSAQQMKNRYAELYLRSMQEYIDSRLDGDGVLLARPGFTGTHKYPFGWSGDNQADFSFSNGLPSVIIAAQTAGLSGLPLFGHDIAGYFGRPSKELFVRWTQFGAFSPLMMVHMTSNLGPWDFDDETLAIYRKFAKLHTSLFPYIFEAAHEAQRTGMPIIRAMLLAYPEDAEAAKHPYQYRFGPDLLVAPMYQGGSHRTVYLPEGEWLDYWTGNRYRGKQTFEVNAPLDTMPLFVRAGAMIPMLPPDVDTLVPRSDSIAEDVVTLDDRRVIRVWPGKAGRFSTWEDMTGTLHADATKGTLSISSSEPKTLEIRFKGRDINELISRGGRHKCDFSAAEAESVCRIGTLKGSADFSWIESG